MRVSPRSPAEVAVAALLALLVLGTEARAAPPPPASFPAAGSVLGKGVVVRAAPSRSARRVAVLSALRADYRLNVVLAYRSRGDSRQPERLWYRISVPGRPNGRRGWVPGDRLRLKAVEERIVVDRSARRLELYRGERRLLKTRVAVGAQGMETPLGQYHVTSRFTPRDPFLGSFALETSAYSRLSEWPGGGVVGIHGTNRPELLGRAVSHGCIRVSNWAARVLKREAPLGTPIAVLR